MKKELMNKGKSDLARAKAEFEQFKRKQTKRSAQPAMAAPDKRAPAPSPKSAYKILHCSQHIGKLSRLEFRLSGSTATGIKATALETSSSRAGAPQSQDLDSFMLKRKIELSGSYNGCPYCGNKSLCRCSCGVISCNASGAEFHKCPSCNREFHLVPLTDAIELTGHREPNQKPSIGDAQRPALPKNRNKAIARNAHKALPHKSTGLLPKK
jgi:hypothetical protein